MVSTRRQTAARRAAARGNTDPTTPPMTRGRTTALGPAAPPLQVLPDTRPRRNRGSQGGLDPFRTTRQYATPSPEPSDLEVNRHHTPAFETAESNIVVRSHASSHEPVAVIDLTTPPRAEEHNLTASTDEDFERTNTPLPYPPAPQHGPPGLAARLRQRLGTRSLILYVLTPHLPPFRLLLLPLRFLFGTRRGRRMLLWGCLLAVLGFNVWAIAVMRTSTFCRLMDDMGLCGRADVQFVCSTAETEAGWCEYFERERSQAERGWDFEKYRKMDKERRAGRHL